MYGAVWQSLPIYCWESPDRCQHNNNIVQMKVDPRSYVDKSRDHDKFLFAKRNKPHLKVSFENLYSLHWVFFYADLDSKAPSIVAVCHFEKSCD